MIHRAACRLLGRHVARRADDDARCRGLRQRRQLGIVTRSASHRLRKTEVQDLDQAVVRHHQIVGLQIAVDDTRSVGLAEPVADLGGNGDRLRDGERAVLEERPQRSPLDELHRDIGGALVLGDVVNGDDVGMVQSRRAAGFTLESLQALGVGGEIAGKNLDGNVPAELSVPGPVNLALYSRRHGSLSPQAHRRANGHGLA